MAGPQPIPAGHDQQHPEPHRGPLRVLQHHHETQTQREQLQGLWMWLFNKGFWFPGNHGAAPTIPSSVSHFFSPIISVSLSSPIYSSLHLSSTQSISHATSLHPFPYILDAALFLLTASPFCSFISLPVDTTHLFQSTCVSFTPSLPHYLLPAPFLSRSLSLSLARSLSLSLSLNCLLRP